MRWLWPPTIVLSAVWLSAGPASAVGQSPSLSDLLDRAARYVAQQETKASGIVFEEDYVQEASRRGATPRRSLRSQLIVINTREVGWMAFRDVFEVDGKLVRDRQDRLVALFDNPSADVVAEARKIADEGARFNLGRVLRNLNYPTMALMFLREEHHARSAFVLGRSERIGSVATRIVEFKETMRPTLVGSKANDVLASGRFWIEPDTGRVHRSQITLEEEKSKGTFDVVYSAWPGLDVLMPASMEEDLTVLDYSTQPETGLVAGPFAVELIRGRARYSDYKQFSVDVKADIKTK